ncbi:MAG: hypothetical protein ACOH5I_13615 [Oligoflexus sp.]
MKNTYDRGGVDGGNRNLVSLYDVEKQAGQVVLAYSCHSSS